MKIRTLSRKWNRKLDRTEKKRERQRARKEVVDNVHRMS